MHPGINYSGSHLNHTLSGLKTLTQNPDKQLDSLIQTLQTKKAETEIVNQNLLNTQTIRGNSLRHRLNNNDEVFITPLFKDDLVAIYSSANSSGNSQLAILSLYPEVMNLINTQKSLLDPENTLDWGINGLENQSKASIDFAFPEGYPNWKLSLYQDQPGWASNLLAPERGVFILIFIFITLMLVVGLYFTLHTLNQEIRLSRLKSDFIANVSHELKSPLTSIRQRAELLTENRVIHDQKPSYYSLILEQSEHLSHLIENILDFSRIEDDRKKYRFEETDINKTIERVIKVFSHLHINSKFKIDFTPNPNLPKIKIDDAAVQQVVFNLVDNAAKFAGESRIIQIEFSAQSSKLRAQSGISIGVRDFGMGISKSDLGRIFDRFYRGEQGREKGIKGSGIGLTICQRIVEAHGGKLEVESEEGKGSTFWIHLPVNKSDK